MRSLPLQLDVHTTCAGWQTALARPPKIKLLDALPTLRRPGVVSFPLSGIKIRAKGFTFAVGGDGLPAGRAGGVLPLQNAGEGPSGVARRPSRRQTRLQLPSDIVKIQDRLFYLLQPPLESLLADGALHFPFEPFGFQLEGIAFLYPRQHAVLADEMGLGKTMQAITTIRLLLHAGEVRRVLLVCPKPLVTNWQQEFERWAPEVPLHVIGGDQARRRHQWDQLDRMVTLANYELLIRDREMLADSSLHFDLVVLDESQRIKNRASATSQVVRSISRTRSWALTGTPVENSAEDLVGIFEFVSPGYLRPGMKPRAIGRAVGEHVLRRTKDAVLTELPPIMFRDAEVELTPEQRETYQRAEEEGVIKLTGLGKELAIQHVFELVLRLKQICNFDPLTGASSKMERLRADLEECAASGRKAIVFSQWVQPLACIKEELSPLQTVEFHGRVPIKARDAAIERFRRDADCNVLLMTYGAGGVGLNLQEASYVFLFDRWWNPAVEDQAINRAHRIGTAGPVTVTRFLARHTIEQRIDEILQEKREIFDTIFSGTQPERNLRLTQEEIFGLFELHGPQGVIDPAA